MDSEWKSSCLVFTALEGLLFCNIYSVMALPKGDSKDKKHRTNFQSHSLTKNPKAVRKQLS